MTANQIIIPLAILAFVVFVLVLMVRSRHAKAQADASRTHRAHSPADQNDRGAMARSAMSGYMGSDK